MHKDQKPIIRIHPAIVAIFGLILGALIFGILAFTGIINFNPYGKGIRINNFSHHFQNVPRSNRNELYANLYKIVDENTPSKFNVHDATIRDDSVVIKNYENDNISYGEFIVDIPSLSQSYRGQFTWSPDSDKNATLTDHNNIITCLATFDLVYDSFGCRNIVTDNSYYSLAGKYPVLRSLPIKVSNYDDEGNRHEYTITYRPTDNNSDITLIISDKTGGNLDSALEYLKKIGVNMENTKISYIDYKAFEELIESTEQGIEPKPAPIINTSPTKGENDEQ